MKNMFGSKSDLLLSKPSTNEKRQLQKHVKSEISKSIISLNRLYNKAISSYESQLEVQSELAEHLDSMIQKDHDLISSLRTRIASISSISNIDKEEDYNAAKSALAEVSPQSVVPYLQHQPLILNMISNTSSNTFIEVINSLPLPVLIPFVDYSLTQLERFVLCFRAYTELISSVGSAEFALNLTNHVQKIFNSTKCTIFMKDIHTGEFTTHLNDIEISIKAHSSFLYPVVKEGQVSIILDPSSSPNFSPSLDPLFNPDNLPQILIPVRSNAVIMVLHTDSSTYNFSNEDLMVGQLLSDLLKPLTVRHLTAVGIREGIDQRKSFGLVLDELADKTRFQDLIPALKTGLERMGIEKHKLFVVDDVLIEFDVNEGVLSQNCHELDGVCLRTVKNNRIYRYKSLSLGECETFVRDIDEWAESMAFICSPVRVGAEQVVAVLCLARKTEFSPWEEDMAESLSSTLSNLILLCSQNLKNDLQSEVERSYSTICEYAAQLDTQQLSEEEQVDRFLKNFCEAINCEQVSIFENANEKLEHRSTFDKKYGRIECPTDLTKLDPTRRQNTIRHTEYSRTLIFSPFEIDDRVFFVVCVNYLGKSGRFSEKHFDIMRNLCCFISWCDGARQIKGSSLSGDSDLKDMQLAHGMIRESVIKENPLQALLEVAQAFKTAEEVGIIQYNILTKHCELIVNNPTNAFNFSLFEGIDFLSNSEVLRKEEGSLVLHCLDKEKRIYFYCISKEDEIELSKTVQMILPYLRVHSITFLERNPTKDSHLYSKFDSFDYKEQILKFDFDTLALTSEDKEKVVFWLLSGLMHWEMSPLAAFVGSILSLYSKSPSEFDVAVDSLQFSCSIMSQESVFRSLTPHQKAAIALACLFSPIKEQNRELSPFMPVGSGKLGTAVLRDLIKGTDLDVIQFWLSYKECLNQSVDSLPAKIFNLSSDSFSKRKLPLQEVLQSL